MNFIHFPVIDSTNSEALRRLAACTEKEQIRAMNKSVITAKSQTAGRGRMGRIFYSPEETGIYFTAIYAPDKIIENPAVLTAAAAVAVCRGIENFYKTDAKIKWVNDVYVNQRKVSGILTEGHLNKNGKIDAAVVGIGINITTKDFPEEIRGRAGSILSAPQCHSANACVSFPRCGETDKELSAGQKSGFQELVENICLNLFNFYENESEYKTALKEYKDRSFIIGHTVQVIPVIGRNETAYSAKVTGIDDEARLLVQTEDGENRALSSGEISIKL